MTDYVGVFPTGAVSLVSTPVSVASGDRIDGADIENGGVFTVFAAGTPTDVTFVDPGKTPAGTPAGTVPPVTVAANTSRSWGRTALKGYINQASNKVVVNYSAPAGVTAQVVG
ncbi:hypothetical protein Drose_06170 [Dactylosporangium roseum]|uniref:Uncharacterized protein n=1 Tax=Dactylosporangium roseum TaxID=47989 RepID=A0ABY5ZA35_9ACTN|nr:hypothetical protein [Dactylosporangium roseum]UWZ37858.1 hypothetical protein Drose_06170 [Dactylosporangium roseum]